MVKIAKYELFLMRFSFFIVLLAIVNNVVVFSLEDHSDVNNILISTIYYAIFLTAILVRYRLIGNNHLQSKKLYFIDRTVFIFIILFGTVFMGMDLWGYSALLFPVMLAGLLKGRRMSLILVALSFVINTIFYLIKISLIPQLGYNLIDMPLGIFLLIYISYYALLTIFAIMCSSINEDNKNRELEKGRLLKELEEKYQQLTIAKEEANYQYEKIKDTNIRLEETNKKLNVSISEFFTLQQISQAISSIFDINVLLKYVNDIIIGVMGVNNSTIILVDDNSEQLIVHTTNITDPNEYKIISNNANDKALLNVLKNNKSLIENFLDKNEFDFTTDRRVNSLMCVPLSTKSRKYGVVLIEHKFYNAFDEDSMRLLEIIGQQVAIALENAKLYQKMQEMATHDCFTGVYNKQYFQELLEQEFDHAKENGYMLSLAIMDADHFKKFNDTYGHLFGDKVLKSIVDLVKDSIRDKDIMARFGGEEFIILFPDTGLAEASEIADTLRKKVNRFTVTDNLVSASVTVSFGVSSFPETSASPVELIRHADNSLYRAKTSGRNCVETACPD